MSNRSFSEWKAQVTVFLMRIKPRNEEMRRQLNAVITSFHTLRAKWTVTGLLYLRKFTDYWEIELPPELLPTKEEISRWFSLDE